MLEGFPSVFAVLLMLNKKLRSNNFFFDLWGSLVFASRLKSEKGHLKLNFLINISHRQWWLLTAVRDLDCQHKIFHEANDPDVEVSLWVFHLEVEEWKPLMGLGIESAYYAVIIHDFKHSFVRKTNPSEIGSLGDWALAVEQSLVQSAVLNLW
jgi:hypothetical protein